MWTCVIIWKCGCFPTNTYTCIIWLVTYDELVFIRLKKWEMSLEQKLYDDYKQAFKEKDDVKKGILNYVVAQLKNKRIELQKDLSDDDVISVIKKEIKSRNESLGYLEQASKNDEIALEKSNIAVLQEYVPQMLSEDQLRALVQETISQLWVQDLKAERGKVVWAIMAQHKATVDGKLLNDIIMNMM